MPARLLSVTLLTLIATIAAHADNFTQRSDFNNARIKFERTKKGHVAFIGGSITEMNGYRPMVCEILQKRFPDTKFTFTDAGISSTCSTTGAFRVQEHVLDHGPVDLFFVEFAVNDDQDAAHARRECIRGFEGLIRHARKHNPNMDIVATYFVNPFIMETLQAGKTPLTIEAHGTVAKHYNVSTINLAKEVAEQITAGDLTWKKFGGVHPAPFGNRICANLIDSLMTQAWAKPLSQSAEVKSHALPDPIDAKSYENGRFISPDKAKFTDWKFYIPDWKAIKGGFRSRYGGKPLLCADKPGATAELNFSGTAIGAFMLAGPDAGIVLAKVDDSEWKAIDTYHRYSRGLHYPRTVMFFNDLDAGDHTLTLKVSESKNKASKGNAIRIMQFTAN